MTSTPQQTIDLKDRRILYELDRDARMSLAQIGKRVGLSTEVVHYRVKRLEEQGIITQYQTAVNYHRLGLIHFKVCIRFNGITSRTEEDIYSKLKHMPQAIWIAKCSGEWDCMISCTVSGIPELSTSVNHVLSAAYPHVNSKAVSISTDIWSFPRSYLLKEKERQISRMGGAPLDLDDTDLRLLRILSQDARQSVVRMSEETGFSAKVITARLKQLLKSGAISNFRLVIDYERLSISFYKTFFYLKNPAEKRFKELIAALNMHPNVVHNLKVIAEWSLEPEFEFENPGEFRKTRQEFLDRFSDIIQDIRTVDIIKEYKYTFFHK